MAEVYGSGGLMIHERPLQAQNAYEALDKLTATFPTFQTSATIPQGYRIITVDDYPYLLGPVGMTWWKNGVLFAPVIRFPPSFGAEQYIQPILSQMVSIVSSVY